MTRRHLLVQRLVLRRLELVRAVDVTPRMRRLTLAGHELGAFERAGAMQPPFASPGFDDHVKLVLAEGGLVEDALPVQLAHGIEWPPSETRRGRDYTPRSVRDDELDLDVVLHGDGPAVRWARTATPGDALWIVGPKSSTVLPDGLDWILLVGDETALPAIARFLEERPTEAPAHVVVVAPDAARQALATRTGDVVRWVDVDPTDGAAIEGAVRSMALPAGTGFVWGAGESRALLPLRRHARRTLALPTSHVSITGYWQHDEDARGPVEHPSPLPWLAVRAAIRLGVLDRLAAGPASLAELADEARVDAAALGALLPQLVDAALVRGGPSRLRLGRLGDALAADEHARDRYVGLEAELALSLAHLADALRTGTSGVAAATGTTLLVAAAADDALATELEEEAERLSFVLDGLVADRLCTTSRTVRLTGPGSSPVARALRGAPAAPAIVERGPADVAILALALEHRTDDEAVALLAASACDAATVVVLSASRPDGLAEPSHEDALLALAATGAPIRDATAIDALAGRAGLRTERVLPLGWGIEAVVLARTATAAREG